MKLPRVQRKVRKRRSEKEMRKTLNKLKRPIVLTGLMRAPGGERKRISFKSIPRNKPNQRDERPVL